jgi:L-alanine-DL-glutamate epimerase-like enolase superfamily enzyme
MQITKAEVTPVELNLLRPIAMANVPAIERVSTVFVRLETVQGESAWGCAVAHPDLTGEDPQDVIESCQDCAELAPDLFPTNLEYSLAKLASVAGESSSAMCAFDLAFHDLFGLYTNLPLHQLLGGYRKRIQTSATIPISSENESLDKAHELAEAGFRMLKIKGGIDPEEDVRRVRAIQKTLPNHILRLDPDGGYETQVAIDVAQALAGKIEMLEQPIPAGDPEALQHVTRRSQVPILADQSVTGPTSVLDMAAQHIVDGISVKVATCGGLRCAQQVDAIARAGRLSTMVSCIIEPRLLTTAGLSYALSSPNVKYADLDGYMDLVDDPSVGGFILEDGWLVANDEPGLGCAVDL